MSALRPSLGQRCGTSAPPACPITPLAPIPPAARDVQWVELDPPREFPRLPRDMDWEAAGYAIDPAYTARVLLGAEL